MVSAPLVTIKPVDHTVIAQLVLLMANVSQAPVLTSCVPSVPIHNSVSTVMLMLVLQIQTVLQRLV